MRKKYDQTHFMIVLSKKKESAYYPDGVDGSEYSTSGYF